MLGFLCLLKSMRGYQMLTKSPQKKKKKMRILKEKKMGHMCYYFKCLELGVEQENLLEGKSRHSIPIAIIIQVKQESNAESYREPTTLPFTQ